MMSSSRWGNAMISGLRAIGFVGPKLVTHCQIISRASVTYITGKTFTTSDFGLTPDNGTGSGTGLTSIQESTVWSTMVQTMKRFGINGPRMMDTARVLTKTFISEMGQVQLSSTHNPVYSGTGTISVGSISTVTNNWGQAMYQKALSMGFHGPKARQYCLAIATGYNAGMKQASGSVSITGSHVGLPLPGSGTGSGTLS